MMGVGLMGLGRADERGQEVRCLPPPDACLLAFVPLKQADCSTVEALERCVCVCVCTGVLYRAYVLFLFF